MKTNATTHADSDALAADVATDSLVAIEDALIAVFGGFCHEIGIPRSFGQIFGLAFVSHKPVSFDTVVARLRLSKGSASQGIRWLREMGLLKPAGANRPGAENSRRGYFVPETDMAALLSVIVRERIQSPLEAGATNLEQLGAAIEELEQSKGRRDALRVRHLTRRLRHLRAWHGKTLKLGTFVQRLSS